MNKNILIAIALFAIVIAGVFLYRSGNSAVSPNTSLAPDATTTPVAKTAFAVYEGRLPCADCEGIDTILTLYNDETYTMSSTYLGREVEPYIENGKWTTLRGDATNPDATVYQLYSEADGSTTDQNYLVVGNELQQLDQDLRPIESPFNTSLTKKTTE